MHPDELGWVRLLENLTFAICSPNIGLDHCVTDFPNPRHGQRVEVRLAALQTPEAFAPLCFRTFALVHVYSYQDI
jgi:hypothetical protein